MLRWLLGIVTFVFTLGFISLYQVFGLRYYIKEMIAINNLGGETKSRAISYFYASDERTYRGTLAFVNTRGLGGVWVWGQQGLKYFAADSNTVYSFYSTCDQKILNALQGIGDISIDDREIYTDIKSWNKRVMQGMFVDVMIAPEENDSNLGKLREIYAYDSTWAFMPVGLDELCVN